ncbi:hypothetical protein [Methanococcoides vulcani]|uniref:hypothetical protein n=1 Tax=Methanococcoides vulcani TaxID=1353158 RepID=UPI001083B351|nr:hypothetical protein [Methanococcoides vulcani]
MYTGSNSPAKSTVDGSIAAASKPGPVNIATGISPLAFTLMEFGYEYGLISTPTVAGAIAVPAATIITSNEMAKMPILFVFIYSATYPIIIRWSYSDHLISIKSYLVINI